MVEWLGLLRSLLVYWRPGRQRRLRRLYYSLVKPGDLVFDVGAHLGDRTAAFVALGARVVALEPQPRVVRWLERLVGGHPRVTVRAEAVGSSQSSARLAISRRTPTVSTTSEEWRSRMPEANASFRGVSWEETVQVPMTTLDTLIQRHGVPHFCKIDVEGSEAEVLAGLSRPVTALSVEFVAGALDVAVACVRRLEELGNYEFNAILGERRRYVFPAWQRGERIVEWLAAGAEGASSGDIYARLVDSRHG